MLRLLISFFLVQSFSSKTQHQCDLSMTQQAPIPEKPMYNQSDLKLRGGKKIDPAFEVKLPKGMELPTLSEAERIKAAEREKAQETNPELSDLDLLRQNLKKLLDSME